MQALRSLFSGSATKKSLSLASGPVGKPVELSAAQLEQVSGGLPRVGSPALIAEPPPPLPRVG